MTGQARVEEEEAQHMSKPKYMGLKLVMINLFRW